MNNNPSKNIVQTALAAACLAVVVNSAAAGAVTRGCAARDMQILMLIEQRESVDTASKHTLSDAMVTMTHARMACEQGRVVDALAIYDTIAQALTADPMLPGRSK